MTTWLQQKELKQKAWRRRQSLGPNVTLTGKELKPFDAQASADRNAKAKHPDPMNYNQRPGWKRRKCHGVTLSVTNREAIAAAAVARLEGRQQFFAALRGED